MITRRSFLATAACGAFSQARKRPNIFVISCENLSANLGCYGDANASTPALDAFATTAIRFERAYAVSGIGSVSRSGLQTGMFPTTLGTHTTGSAVLPSFVKPFTEYLKASGYHIHAPKRPRPAGAPLFRWIRLDATNPNRIRLRGDVYDRTVKPLKPEQRKSPDQLPFPPQFEDSEEARRDWANYYEMTALLDRQFAARLKEIPQDEPAIVVFLSEYGFTLREGNSAAYESGTRVPVLIRVPGLDAKADPQLMMLLDLAPTLLNLAGVEVPGHMQGRAVLGGRLSPPRRYVFATCDRPDYRYETVRSVRDNRYRYVLNLSKRKAELFDSNGDPNEVNDISAANKELTERLHKRWEQWRDETRDLGLIPEADLANREAAFGTRYAAGRQAGFDSLLQRLSTAAPADPTEWITDSDAAIRYRACSTASEAMLRKLLSDPSGAVRVQAALLLRQRNSGYAADSMKVLLRALRSGEEWLRMQAALALEEIGDKDLAVLNALQAVAKSDKNRAVATVAARATKGSA